MGIIEGGVKRAPITRTFEYDFAADGGAQGAIALSDADGRSGVIPDDAIITGATLEGITTATSGGSATIALVFVRILAMCRSPFSKAVSRPGFGTVIQTEKGHSDCYGSSPDCPRHRSTMRGQLRPPVVKKTLTG